MIEASLVSPTTIVFLPPLRERNQRHVPKFMPLANSTRNLVAVHLRHADIQQHHIGPLLFDRLDGRHTTVHNAHIRPPQHSPERARCDSPGQANASVVAALGTPTNRHNKTL